MRSCGFCVRPTNFAGYFLCGFEQGATGLFHSNLQNKNGNADPPGRIMMPQSSMECLMKGAGETYRNFPSIL